MAQRKGKDAKFALKNGHAKKLEPEPEPEPEPVEPVDAMPMGMDDVLLGAEDERTEMDKVLEIATDPGKIGYFTQLNPREIMAFSALGAVAKRYPQFTMLRHFLAQNLEYRVSLNRKGREELVKIVGRQLAMSEERQEVNGWRGLLHGRGR